MGGAMSETAKNVSVSYFKTHCLTILDEIAKTGLPLIVTKRGKPIAKLIPFDASEPPNLLGSVRYKREEDLLSPLDETWEADQ